MEMPLVDPNDDGIRPAGDSDKCFYCKQKIGTPHRESCVCVTKRIKALYIFEVEVEIPWGWDKEEFESHRNESSWCANNAVEDLFHKFDPDGNDCACSIFKAEFLEVIDNTPTSKIKGNER